MHRALDCVARMCIDENFLDEAERMLAFLEMAGVSAYTSGLLNVWARSQRGELRDALRQCSAMHESYPDSSDVAALLAVLRFACGESTWRPLCERLMEWPTCRAESRQVAASLLDGSFGRKDAQASAAEPAIAAAEPAPMAGFDFAHATHYLRG
jgi:hypothetical protein